MQAIKDFWDHRNGPNGKDWDWIRWFFVGFTVAAILLGGASVANAQNPPGAGLTDFTSSGATILISPGGVAPYTLYEPDGSGGWDQVAQTNNLTLVVNFQAPNSTVGYNLTGSGVAPGSGITVSITSLPVPAGPFNDVASNHWAVDQIQWMKDTGISAGCGNGNYCPDAAVERDQMAVFLCRLYEYVEPNGDDCNGDGQ